MWGASFIETAILIGILSAAAMAGVSSFSLTVGTELRSAQTSLARLGGGSASTNPNDVKKCATPIYRLKLPVGGSQGSAGNGVNCRGKLTSPGAPQPG